IDLLLASAGKLFGPRRSRRSFQIRSNQDFRRVLPSLTHLYTHALVLPLQGQMSRGELCRSDMSSTSSKSPTLALRPSKWSARQALDALFRPPRDPPARTPRVPVRPR